MIPIKLYSILVTVNKQNLSTMKTFTNYNGQRFDHYVKQVSRFTQMLEVNPHDWSAKRNREFWKTELFLVMQIMQEGNKVKA